VNSKILIFLTDIRFKRLIYFRGWSGKRVEARQGLIFIKLGCFRAIIGLFFEVEIVVIACFGRRRVDQVLIHVLGAIQ
jgi:hypothetical protein